MGTQRKHDFEPYWQDEKDWLCTVGFLPKDDPEARLVYSAGIIGYLVEQLREGFAIIDRALEIMAKAVESYTNCAGLDVLGACTSSTGVNYRDDWGCFARPRSDSATARIEYVDEAQESPT